MHLLRQVAFDVPGYYRAIGRRHAHNAAIAAYSRASAEYKSWVRFAGTANLVGAAAGVSLMAGPGSMAWNALTPELRQWVFHRALSYAAEFADVSATGASWTTGAKPSN